MELIYALVKKPGCKPETMVVGNDLESLQEVIGGHLEMVSLPDLDAVMIVDEEGKLKGNPYNFTIRNDDIVGTVIFCGVGDEDFTDIGPDALHILRTVFEKLEDHYRRKAADICQ